MSKQVKILVVGDFLLKSGLTEYIFETFGKLGNKYSIDVISYGGKNDVDSVIKSYSWKKYEVTSVHKSIITHIKDWIKVLKQCSKKNYDIIHFNYSSSWNFFPVLLAKRILKSKIVIHSHSSYYSNVSDRKIVMWGLNLLNRIGQIIFNKRADAKVATSEPAAYWMFRTKKNVKIINNGIDLKKYDFSENKRKVYREKLNILQDSTKALCFVGALRKLKNPDFVLEIFEEYRKLNKDSKLFVFGDGTMKKDLQRKVKQNSLLRDSVTFGGVVDNIPEILQAMDYFVFPSQSEGYGLALAEAEAAGLHAVVSNNIPNSVVINSLTKVKSLKDSPKEWADAIYRDIDYSRKSKYQEMFDKGFDISNVTSQIDNLYNEILE
ncbi:glycosyltransferase [Pediococcus acidilactici]